jgi:uncharacterized protein involved in propanediol utilization
VIRLASILVSLAIADIWPRSLRRIGRGSSASHWGEWIQGEFLTASGRRMRALVSAPCPCGVSTATFEVRGDLTDVSVEPAYKSKAAAAARLTLEAYGAGVGGHLTIESTIAEGRGCGSSTADATATVRAVSDALGVEMPSSEIGRIVVLAEKAADGVMFGSSTVLFAQRDGVVLEDFGLCLPPVVVVGALVGDNVDTLALELAPYSEADIARFETLRVRLRAAARDQDVGALADVATTSARINQRHLPLPGYEALEEAADLSGAAGVVISHSGAVGGLIFDPRDDCVDARVRAARFQLDRLGLTVLTTFCTDDRPLPSTITEAA